MLDFFKNPLICAVNINEREISAIIVEKLPKKRAQAHAIDQNFPFEILACEHANVKGYSNNLIHNHQELAEAIENAVAKAEAKTELQIDKISFSMALKNIEAKTFLIERIVQNQKITQNDLDALQNQAKKILAKNQFEKIDINSQECYLDETKQKIQRPIGTTAKKIMLPFTVIEFAEKASQQIEKLQQQLNFQKKCFYPYPIVLGALAKNWRQPQKHKICIYVGQNSSSIIYLDDGNLRFSNQIDIGMKTAIDRVFVNLHQSQNAPAIKKNTDKNTGNNTGYDPEKALMTEANWLLVEQIGQQMKKIGYDNLMDKNTIVNITADSGHDEKFRLYAQQIFEAKVEKIKPLIKNIKANNKITVQMENIIKKNTQQKTEQKNCNALAGLLLAIENNRKYEKNIQIKIQKLPIQI